MTQEEMLSQMEMMLQPLQQVNASQAETIKKLTEQNESLQSRARASTTLSYRVPSLSSRAQSRDLYQRYAQSVPLPSEQM